VTNIYLRTLTLILLAGRAFAAVPLLDHTPPTKPPLKVFIDVGHGGKDRGARGLFGIQESELCLTIGRKVAADLKVRATKEIGRPVEIRLSRDRDEFLSLSQRVDMANSWSADLFLSIHANSSPVAIAHGFEVYFLSPEATDEAAKKLALLENEGEPEAVSTTVMSILSDAQTTHHVKESSDLAEILFQSLSRDIQPNVRGVRQAPFSVLAGTQMPAVLIEVGYLNHIIDASHLTKQSYLKHLSDAISTGIIHFFGRSPKLSKGTDEDSRRRQKRCEKRWS
jgi:N-acetylmuramoyl-L-alanine amidase